MSLLQEVGEALYGARWQTELARELGIADRTMRRFVAGTHPVPPGIYLTLLNVVEERSKTLADLVGPLKAARAGRTSHHEIAEAPTDRPLVGPTAVSLILSQRQIKAMNRVGGANLILDWPAGLPHGTPLERDHEREATPAERVAAEALVTTACAAAGLVPVHVRVVNIRRPSAYPRGGQYETHLAVTIIGRRWVHATGRHDPPDVWPPPK